MRKGAARNMQRLSRKMELGTAPPQNRDVQQAPVYKQVRAMELRRLARIRFSFEIEQQIADKMSAGESVGLLREQLLGVRNGTIEPPRYSIRPTGDPMRVRKKKVDWAAEQQRNDRRVGHEKRLYRTEREVGADLADLAKGKLTPTGIGAIKGMLDRFDEDLVVAVLGLKPDFIRKVSASAAYRLAPDLSPKDGLLLSEVLESRLPVEEKDDRPPSPALAAPASGIQQQSTAKPTAPPNTAPHVRAISVDAISGAEYTDLRSKGWTIAGAWMYPPGVAAQPVQVAPAARRQTVIPTSKARVAVAPAKPAKSAKKAKPAAKKKPGAKGQRPVSLSPEAWERLRSHEAFKQTSLAPRKAGTLSVAVERTGFVAPPASTEINWRDESEDGSMWDR